MTFLVMMVQSQVLHIHACKLIDYNLALDIFRFGLLLQSVYDKDEDQVVKILKPMHNLKVGCFRDCIGFVLKYCLVWSPII